MSPQLTATRKRRAEASRKRMAARGVKTWAQRESAKQNHPAGGNRGPSAS